MQTADSYNRGGFIAFLFSMVFSLVFFVYIAFLHPGIDLKEVSEEGLDVPAQAGAPQTQVLDVSKVDNPWVPSDDLATHGKQVFQQNCAVCHGSEGKGDGPAGKSLVPPPRDLVKGDWKKGGTSIDLFTTVTKGLEGTSMAPFGHLPLVDRWSLVHFIRSITENKPEDNPEKLEAFAKQAN